MVILIQNISPLYFGGDDEETMKNNTLEYLVKLVIRY